MVAQNIYIDHLTDNKNEQKFIAKLKLRLARVNSNFKVLSYSDIKNSIEDDKKAYEHGIKVLKSSSIIIPIITNDYLDEITSEEKLENEIIKATNDKNRNVFPIIYEKSNWVSVDWIMKSRIFPSNSSISESDDTEINQVFDNLILNVESLLSITKQEKDITIKMQVTDNFVFISHSHNDADFAELLKLKLEKHGIPVWIDSDKLKIGQDWREEIDLGIKNSLALIVVMTPEAKSSEYVTYEWAYAWGQGKKIFPILLSQTQLHPRLESLQYLNFSNRSTRPWLELIESIKKINT